MAPLEGDLSENASSPPTGRRRLWRALPGLLLSAAIVAVAAGLLDWQDILRRLAAARVEWLAVAAACLLVGYWLFALRWKLFIHAPRVRIPVRDLFGHLMIGLMTNALIPLRPGDLVRATLLRQRHAVPIAPALGSIVVERLFDVTGILAFGGLLRLLSPLPPLIDAALGTFAALAGAGAAALAVFASPNRVTARLLMRAHRVRHRTVQAMALRAEQVRQALQRLARPLPLIGAAILTLAGWAAFAAAMSAGLAAMNVAAPASAGILVMVAVALGSAVPSSPGSIGVFHFLAVLALSAFGVSQNEAAAYAVVVHALTVAVQLSCGALAAARSAADLRALFSLRPSARG